MFKSNQNLALDEIVLYMTGRDRELVKFNTSSLVVEPGAHIVTLFCPVSQFSAKLDLADACFKDP